MHTQEVNRKEEQLETRQEGLGSYTEDTLQVRNETKVAGHRSYTADLYGVELLMQS